MSNLNNNRGVNLSEVKRNFLKLDQKGLYQKIFYGFSLIAFILSFYLFFFSDISSVESILRAKGQSAPLYLVNRIFTYIIPLGILVLIATELAAYFRKNTQAVNRHFEMVCFTLGYLFGIVYIFLINPFNSFFAQYINNRDPFKQFNISTDVLSSLHWGTIASTIALSFFFFGLGYIVLLCKKNRIVLRRSRKRTN